MLLYVGPDQLIPLSGVLGALAGLALIFWGKIVQAVQKAVRVFSRSSEKDSRA